MALDDLRTLQAAIRDYLRLERQADELVESRMREANVCAAEVEKRLSDARRRLHRLAGIDETE